MMFRCCCLFLLVNLSIGLLPGTGITPKYVCPGHAVQLFTMTNFDSCNAVVSLFVNGDRNTQIANWTLYNCTLNSYIQQDYNDRIYFNKTGIILIHDVHRWDEGKYTLTKVDKMPMTYEEQIYVMASPTQDCRPIIEQLSNSLHATLKHDACGKPLATVYWKDCCGVSYSNESVLKLSPGKEACTCYACIVSPALNCTNSSMPQDYCSTYSRAANTPTVSSETWDVTMLVLIVTVIIVVILLVLFPFVIFIRIRRRRDAGVQQRYKKRNQSEKVLKPLNRRNCQLSNIDESPVETITTTLNTDDTTGRFVSTASVTERPEQSTNAGNKTPQAEPEPETDEATTKHQTSQDSKRMIRTELDVDHCTSCRNENVAMYVRPSEHPGSCYTPTSTI